MPMRTIGRWLGWSGLVVVVLGALVWSVAFIYFSNLPSAALRVGAAVAFGVATVAAFALRADRKRTLRGFLLAFAVLLVWWWMIEPSHDRDWEPEYAVLPHATIDGNVLTVHDIRNFHYETPEDFDIAYYDKTFNLDDLTSVDFSLSYWDGNTDIAHVITSFGFRDEDYLAFSLETRRELGEAWNPAGGLFKQFELILVVADERDLIGLRTNTRGEQVFLYPTVLSPEEGRGLLLNFIGRVNNIYEKPEFYNTITQNCLTGLLAEIHAYRRKKQFDFRLLRNGLSDQMAYESGLIDTDIGFDATKARHHINQYVRNDQDDVGFSRRIRPHLSDR